MKRYRIVYLLLLIGSLIGYFLTIHWCWLILMGVLLVAELVSYAFLVMGYRKVEINYKITDTCIIHQPIPVNLQLHIGGNVPLGVVELRLRYNNLVFQDEYRQIIYLEQGRNRKNQYELPYIARDCGKVCITVEQAKCYDMLGIFYRRISLPREEEFVVYPMIPDIQVEMTSRPSTINTGTHYDTHRKGQDVTEVFDLRDYNEGDSIKSIHWKLSEKLDRLVVREFGHPSNYQTVIYYDTDLLPVTEEADYREVCDGVLGMADAISKGLMEAYQFHRVLTINHNILVDEEVSSMDSYMEMLNNQMSRPIIRESMDHLMELITSELYAQFSKLILVTGYIDMTIINQIAENISVTVIVITKDGEQSLETGINYNILTIPIDDLQEKVRGIEI